MSNIDFERLEREVQQSFGRCMLRLQEYELLLKTLIIHRELKGTVNQLKQNWLEREENFATDSLGSLVKEFLKSHVAIEGAVQTPLEDIKDISEPLLNFRSNIQMSEMNYEKTKDQLEELTSLRNNLAHHFLQQFDIKTIDGCSKARTYLDQCFSLINTHFSQMQTWIDSFTKAQGIMASFAQTETFSDLVVNGITPDGKVCWPIAGIVVALREAAGKLNVNGWTNLHEAKALIEAAEPDQTPAKYHCSTWQQVLHDSRIFIIEYRQTQTEEKQAWYSERSIKESKAL